MRISSTIATSTAAALCALSLTGLVSVEGPARPDARPAPTAEAATSGPPPAAACGPAAWPYASVCGTAARTVRVIAVDAAAAGRR